MKEIKRAIEFLDEAQSDMRNEPDKSMIHIHEAKRCLYKILREKRERETEPKPLTLEQLREMDFNDCKTDTAVWIREIYGEILGQSNFAYRALLDKVHNKIIVISGEGIGRLRDDNYGKTWLAYAHKPKEAR